MALDLGVGAVHAFPLTAGAALGTLTLYRRDDGTPLTDLADARELAELAAIVLLAGGEP